MTRWKELALSPYFHKHEETQRLVDYLSTCFPDFTERQCAREAIWEALFPGQAHDQGKLAVLFTYAQRLADEFLALEQLRQEEGVRNRWLLTQYRERQVWRSYEKKLRQSRQRMAQVRRRDVAFYQDQLALAAERNQYYLRHDQRREDRSLEEKQQALDHYYLLEKLRDAVEMQVRRQILSGSYSARLLEAVIQELDQNAEAYQEAPTVQVYYRLYLMMTTPSLHHYQQALADFQDHEQHFGPDETATIYNYFQNFCIGRINQNEAGFLRELFQLYRAQLDRGLLMEDGYLVEWHYKNIVTTALRLGELDWTEGFIEGYKQQLSPAAADNAYRFNLAALRHAQGDYGKVLELLTRVEYSDLRYNLGAKALLMRTYYELEEFEALTALVDTFRQYLQRNRLLADSRRSGYYHLFRLARRAANLRAKLPYQPADKSRTILHKLRQDLAATEAVFNRGWLEEKLELIEDAL
ncbi:MAG: hypothetical protein KDC54_09985 [Lewinella sp.]|nr:hypothetical protein [Lewinella sp.]